MKLLKLSSSNPRFKTLKFEPGLNIVAGLQLSDEDKKTYNGIGKSFSLNLLHLMLGSDFDVKKSSEKKVKEFLAGYGSFELIFTHRDKNYTIQKNFGKPEFYINNEKVTKSRYPQELKQILCPSGDMKTHSIKNLLNCFARQYRSGAQYYGGATTQQGQPESDYYQKYANLALLGIDTSIVTKKFEVKERINSLGKAKKELEKYDTLINRANVKDLKDQLKKLIDEKEQFIIAENYDKLKQQADSLTEKLNEIRNVIYVKEKALARKRNSLETSQYANVDIDKVKRIYDESQFFFSDDVQVRLEQANTFHQKILQSRTVRLKNDITQLDIEIKELQISLKRTEEQRDAILKDLNSKGALEEYNSIVDHIRTLEAQISELDSYNKALQQFNSDSVKYNLTNAKVDAEATSYLENQKTQLEDIENRYRELVKRFYENSGGSLGITKSKDARYLFDIDVHVPGDGSQGINEIKIFCYDLLLHQLNPNLLGFLAHDGCLFSEVDPRQKSMIFKVILDYLRTFDMQYFVNIGESSLKEVLDEENKLNILTNEEKLQIENGIILELYDKDPSKRLFGEKFG